MKSFIVLASALLICSVSAQYPNLKVIVTNGNSSQTLLLSTLDTTLATSTYNSSLKTVIYFFGYTSTYAGDPTNKRLQTAFETLGGYNFLIGDWSAYNTGSYLTMGGKMKAIAGAYATKFAAMIAAGKLNLANLHFMGHSLGAHLAGGTARQMKVIKATNIVPRLTALDPAGLFIYPKSILMSNYVGMAATDAAFVDVIHTDRTFGGTNYKVGHVDFWPNNATNPQPGCPTPVQVSLIDQLAGNIPLQNYCSHHRSVEFFIESIVQNPSKTAFPSVKCSSTQSSTTGSVCTAFNTAVTNLMGFYATKTNTGNFFLKTNVASPYNTGVSGY